jgi:hypothetical protein
MRRGVLFGLFPGEIGAFGAIREAFGGLKSAAFQP